MPPDVEETVVEEGITTTETQEQDQETYTQEGEVQEATQEDPPKEDPQERNWQQTRRRMSELESTVKQQNELISRMNAPSKDPEPGSDWRNVDKTDVFDAGQTIKSTEDIVEERIAKAFKQREYEEAPNLIKSEHKDYPQVVTPENIERLKKSNPRLAASLAEVKDPYALGALTYSYIKSQGIYNENNNAQTRQRAISNSKKPLPVTAAKSSNALESANAYANGLTPDLQQQLWSEMQAAIRKG